MFGFEIPELILRLVAGTFIGFCIGLTGVGGGVLVIPTLTLLFKLPASTAVGTASLYSFITKVSATFHHYKLKTVDTMTATWFLVGAIPTNIAVAAGINAAVHRLGSESEAIVGFQNQLKLFIATVIIASCVLLVINMIRGLRNGADAEVTGLAKAVTSSTARHRTTAALLGTIVGALIGSTSVGGGVIIVPMLIFFFGMTSSRTVGTSILIAVVLTLVTSAVFLIGGEMDIATAVCMAVGSLVGVPIGSRLSVKLPDRALKVVVVAVIVTAAVLMLRGNSGH
ncbi:MAG: sulfite exporter TauE/SafE family protein [Kiritimatiellia bacterium]|nr:sulfite exporter TauE/SafE family protein [Kiritimatiellia bacterium]MDP6630834.1 sulfite exporter TauE/SafE family protein [Kiritimatiellia bacterium]MDP6811287.1 sulfite exporter TauE/SafE family protein [Kiritimatiellia bacterium]MDP7024099.1 sulfite exporter TauE/SafE family protein [Kiritimatiellia bacterium]